MGLSFTIAAVIASVVILRSETPSTWRTRFPDLYLPGSGWPGYTPRHCVPFPSPPTTLRVMVEVFDPASIRGAELRVRVRVTLRLGVYRQPVRLDIKSLETREQRFFQLKPCGHSPYVTSSLTRRWASLMNMLGLSSSVHFAHIACY
jgi:hypothetical protein